jgi:hypothetical protein
MSELVLNSPHWSDTGAPVHGLIQLQDAAGMTVNVKASPEAPLQLGRCACRR